MNVTRKQVANALLALLQGGSAPNQPGLNHFISDANAQIKTFSRIAKIWSNVATTDQPYLFISSRKEDIVTPDAFGLQKYSIPYWLVIYARRDAALAANTPPEDILNEILDALDEVLSPALGDGPDGQQTLGGLVANVAIEGEVLKDEGVLDEQMAVTVPLRITTGT